MKYDHVAAAPQRNPAYVPVRHPEVERNKSFGHDLEPWRKSMSTCAPGITMTRKKTARDIFGMFARSKGIA